MVYLPYLVIYVCMIDHVSAFQSRIKVRPMAGSWNRQQQPIQSQVSNDVSSHSTTTTASLHSMTPVSSFMSIGTIMAVLWSNVAIAHAEVINVFQPTLDPDTVQSSSFGAVYVLGAIVPYFVLNAIIAPKLGLSKEVSEEKDSDSMTPPNNKSPF